MRDFRRRHARIQIRFVPCVRRNKKNLIGGQVSRHIDLIQSRTIRFVSQCPSQIASPHFNYNSPFLRLTISDHQWHPPISSSRPTILRPTCITLFNIHDKYDRNRCRSRHPAVDKLRHSPGLVRPSACHKQIDWPSATRLRDEIFYVLVVREGVTRTTQGK